MFKKLFINKIQTISEHKNCKILFLGESGADNYVWSLRGK